MQEFRQLATSGLLGYGFPEDSLAAGMARDPHMIGVDGGSTDPGPYYLGSGKCVNSRMSMKRDLRLMLQAARSHKIPMVIGSCGGAGGEPHVQTVADLVREIAREDGMHFKLAVIHAEQDKEWVKQQMQKGKVKPFRNGKTLAPETVDRATRVVGMMGPEPFMAALDSGADVVLAGRSSDPAPWAGCAMRAQFPPGPAWYAGKMLECGATAALPKGHDCLVTSVDRDGIVLEATNPIRKCTPFSVANHSLHENASPCFHTEPGGLLDTSDCKFEAVSDRAVRVSGMKWTPQPYTVKLEGAELAGYRAITICGTRDPMLIAIIDDFLASVRENVAFKAEGFGVKPDQYHAHDPQLWRERCHGRLGADATDRRSRDRLCRGGCCQHAGDCQRRPVDRPGADAPCRFQRTALQGREHGVPLFPLGYRNRSGLPLLGLPHRCDR